jgi:hypothetical protein
MREVAHVEGLGGALLAIAADTPRVERLYQVLERYCHRLRNRLNCLKMSLYLAKRMETGDGLADWTELEARYRTLEQLMEEFQVFYGSMSLQPIRAPLGMFLDEHRQSWVQWLGARGRKLELLAPATPAIGEFDPSRLGQCLDALVAWRAEVGPPEIPVRVRWWAGEGRLHLLWEEPGARLQEEAGARDDRRASLALPMVARVVAAHRGTLDISLRDAVSLCLSWPIDVPHT